MKEQQINNDQLKGTGFSIDPRFEGSRLLKKDGSFNVRKTGFKNRFSMAFQHLIEMSWLSYSFALVGVFLVINIVFTCVYAFGMSDDAFTGLDCDSKLEHWLNLFYFSVQTITTVGYGSVSPAGHLAGMVSSVQSFFGVLGFAFASGITYGRYAKPRAKIIFSESALVAPYKEGKALMIRLANARDTQMINAEAKVMLAKVEVENGVSKRKFFSLDLEISHVNFLPTSWTVVHPINEESPFYKLDQNAYHDHQIEVLVQIIGYDDTYNQTVNARSSYRVEEIEFDASFVPIYDIDGDGTTIVDLEKIGSFEFIK